MYPSAAVGRLFLLLVSVFCGALLLVPRHPVLAQKGGSDQRWVGTWATASFPRIQTPPPPAAGGAPRLAPLNFNNQTLRQIVHVSLGGDCIRVVLSNVFGTAPLAIGAARVSLHQSGSAIVPTSDRVLTFGGSPTTTIHGGNVVVSDPVQLTVPDFSNLAIDLFLPGDTAASTSPLTTHQFAMQTNYVSTAGDHTGAPDLPVATTSTAWFFLARVEVMALRQAGVVVAFGESTTDGNGSTQDGNDRWPDALARRLKAQNIRMAGLNLGIAGNRILNDGGSPSALARFDRDVLAQPGVTHVIDMGGGNDISARQSPSPTAADIIAGHKQLIERAHAHGLKIVGATLTPLGGGRVAWPPENEAKRLAVNEWIRTGKAYDGFVDFDAVIRNPQTPTTLLPQFASMDNIHPNGPGYLEMAKTIDLRFLK
jgi:lysophospholipase L1-like esterase